MRQLAVPIVLLAACATPSAPPPKGLTNSGPTEQDVSAVQKQVRLRLTEIKGCFETQRRRDPLLSGKVIIHWIIDRAGRATNVDIEQNTTGNATLAECIGGLVARWSFPPPQGGPVEVSFPFVFQASR
ncbi:MAG TPA: AgmX/PglI C-terminal domain-containing protein [Polyangia bacterium]|nr:AgmX/PglI C-terminal domain-containing protein [Polyangia bacterium]